MRRTILYLAAVVIMACGSGGGGGGGSESPDKNNPFPKVTVTGNIYNQAVVASLRAPQETRAVAEAYPPYSILNAMAHDVERLADISQGTMVTVDLYVKNGHGIKYDDTTYEIGIEDISGRTREGWECWECFNSIDQTRCNGYGAGSNGWQVEGGFFYNTVDSPALPVCDDTVAFISGTCHTEFFPGFDCGDPSYEVQYAEPSNGLYRIRGTITELKKGGTFNTSASYSHSAMDIRANHLAWFCVRDSENTILAEKFYIFDVIP